MDLLTPTWLMRLEHNMRVVASRDYDRLTQNLWWNVMTKSMTSTSKKEILIWLLNTAKIDILLDGEVHFEGLETHMHEYEHDFAGQGLKLNRSEFEDSDGKGIEFATEWSSQIGAYSAYWPQERVSKIVRENTVKCYDGEVLFSQNHHINPAQGSGAGVFANDFTGAAAGAYPGALPIHESGAGAVTLDVALANLGKAIAYIQSIKMPNGRAPRNLRVSHIVHPPLMNNRVLQLTNSKLIVQAGTGGAGSADVESILRSMGLATPVQATELGSAFGGDDQTYYLVVEDVVGGEVGALIYSEREAFQILWHGLQDDAQLARMNELQWMVRGRNAVTTGHPFGIFRFQGS